MNVGQLNLAPRKIKKVLKTKMISVGVEITSKWDVGTISKHSPRILFSSLTTPISAKTKLHFNLYRVISLFVNVQKH